MVLANPRHMQVDALREVSEGYTSSFLSVPRNAEDIKKMTRMFKKGSYSSDVLEHCHLNTRCIGALPPQYLMYWSIATSILDKIKYARI
jgi:hypothetical protein